MFRRVPAATGAKLLDFGLAKPVSPLASGMTLTADTPRVAMTEEGTTVGTFQYMSPEQVEGKEPQSKTIQCIAPDCCREISL
jgi:serine/threonine protein kinase